MAGSYPNSLYDKGRQKFLDGSIAWSSDDIKVALIDIAAYSVDLANDEYLSDIPGAAIVATSGNLVGKTSTAGVADAADATFLGVAGPTVEAAVVYKDTGAAATSPLIAYIDDATGLPLTPDGGTVLLQWDDTADRIFKL